MERRGVLRAGAAALAAGVAAAAGSHPALARAALIGKQAPAFYRQKIGAFEITVISDGTVIFPVESLWSTAPAADVKSTLEAEYRPSSAAVLQLNTIVVNTGDKLVLVDSGTGGKFQGTSGNLIANLATAGFRPEQIDAVVFTHWHPDHLWGVTDAKNATLLFANAEYVATETEHGFWSAPELSGKVPSGMKAMVDNTQVNIGTIAGRFRPVKPGAEILPGVTSVDTPGHTPGHNSIQITSGNDALLVSGDVVANAAVSFHHPEWAIGFDMDKELAAKTRAAFLDRCATDRLLVASYHLPFPAVGHVARDGGAYRWVPAEWQVAL